MSTANGFDMERDSPFAITVLSDRVAISDGEGQATFTVANRTSLRRSVFLSVVPADGTPADWFHLQGGNPKDLAPDEAAQAVVAVAPSAAMPGEYGLRLRAVDVDEPDEYFAESQMVPFELAEPKEPEEPEHRRSHWLPSFVGASTIGFGGFFVGLVITIVATSLADDLAEGFGSLLVGLFASLILFWIGGCVGAYVGHRISDQQHRVLKTGLFAILTILIAPLLFGLFALIIPDVAAVAVFLLVVATLLNFAASAYLASWLGDKAGRLIAARQGI